MRIALIDSFFDTSHKLWADGLVRHSSHSIDIYAGSAHHWKWKMTGGTYELAQQFVASGKEYDLLLVSDMVNLPLFRSFLTPALFATSVLMYFHENQITYPWSDALKREDRNYGWINYVSACQADVCLFNSEYHLKSFTAALPGFLKPFPKFNWKSDYNAIVEKSEVLPIGLDLPTADAIKKPFTDIPVFLWNHRWEYDKAPEVFFNTLITISKNNIEFKLIVLGKGYKRSPTIFEEAREVLEKHIIHWGWVDTQEDYRALLLQANIMFVTSEQDFFGISIIEAISHGCYPILPDRLAYPEHVSEEHRKDVFYTAEDNLEGFIAKVIKDKRFQDTDNFSSFVRKYDWKNMIDSYDKAFDQVILKNNAI